MTSATSIRAGRAHVEIAADTGPLDRGLRLARARLEAFGATLRAVGQPLATAGAALVGGLVGAAKSYATVGASLHDLSLRTGASVESLSALGYAARQSGTDLTTVEVGLRNMQRVIASASAGTDSAVASLAALGVTAAQLQQMSPAAQLAALADGLTAITDPAQRTAAAVSLFGRSGTSLLPMLSQGSAGLRVFAGQAAAVGQVMDATTAAAAKELDDRMTDLMMVLHRLAVEVGRAVAPAVLHATLWLTGAAAATREWLTENQALVSTALTAAAVIGALGGALLAGAVAAKAVAAGLAAVTLATRTATAAAAMLSAAWAALAAHPVLRVLSLVAAAATMTAAAFGANALWSAGGDAAAAAAAKVEELRHTLEQSRAAAKAAAAAYADATAAGQPDAATAVTGGNEGQRLSAEWQRRVRQLRIAEIEDEHQRELAAIDERYEHELAEARRLHADLATLRRIAEARDLEIAAVRRRLAERQYADLDRLAHDARMTYIEGIEDAYEREIARIEETHRYRLRNAREWEVAGLEALRAAELEVAAAREAARLRERAAAIATADTARQENIAELELRARYRGVALERELLRLQWQRTRAAAEAAGESVKLVDREFQLRARLLLAEMAADATGALGTFSAAAAGQLFPAGALERTAANTTELVALTRRLLEERDRPPTFSG